MTTDTLVQLTQQNARSTVAQRAGGMQEGKYKGANRMFFLSIPPGVFVDAAQGAAGVAKSQCVAPLPPQPPSQMQPAGPNGR